jgi:hypothetical protein
MALKTKFVGKSANGDLAEAIQNALEKARKIHTTDKAWVIERIAQNQLTFPPLSVLILVGGGKGDGGIGPKKPG